MVVLSWSLLTVVVIHPYCLNCWTGVQDNTCIVSLKGLNAHESINSAVVVVAAGTNSGACEFNLTRDS